jgi:DNA-directed RNA polymerase I subunit RPA2
VWIEDVQVGRPMLPDRDQRSVNRLIYPSECRERGVTYQGKLMAKICWQVNEGPVNSETRMFGQLPVLVRVSANFIIGTAI